MTRRSVALALLAWLAALPAGCTAPIVQPAGDRELSVAGLPAGTEVTSAVTADGLVLRGLFVPAGDGAPVVLHLLPSSTSITTGMEIGFVLALDGLLWGLHEFGFASLVLDYRGVGASDGEPDPAQLPVDAEAMWFAAVERAGAADRVVVRAGSVGTLAATALLDHLRSAEHATTPAAAVLIAPIRAETIATHAARQRHGSVFGTLTSCLLRRPLDTDLLAVLRATTTPLLVVLPEHDVYLDDDEIAQVVAAADRPGNRVERLLEDHDTLIARAYGWHLDQTGGKTTRELAPAEVAFLRGLGLVPSAADREP